jgi:hypothetical protein
MANLRASRRYLLVLLLVGCTFFFIAAAPDERWARGVLLLLTSSTLAISVWTSHSGGVRAQLLMVGVLALAAALQIGSGSHTVTGTSGAVSGLFLAMTMFVIARGIVGQKEVNQQTVVGAICVFLLGGLLFAFLYSVAAVLGDGAFFAQGTDGDAASRLYFSFVTLTTVGYGDFSPAAGVGRTLANMEALFGQLYLVTVVAVIVGRITYMQRSA